MVKSIRDFMQAGASLLMLVLILMLVPSCTSYKFGDVSRIYCGATNAEIRADLKVTLADKGLTVGVDYCASVGLVDAMRKAVNHE